MKINYKVFVSFAITLQILILLFAIASIPAIAAEETPSLPLVLQGTVELNGEPAPINTEITAKVDSDVVGTTEVDQEGIFGSQPGTKLYITCDPDDYEDIKFYVNGVESELLDVEILKNAKSGDILESINIIATSPDGDGTGTGDVDYGGSGSSGGGGIYSETAITSDSSDSGTDDESSSASTASAGTTSLMSVATTQSTDDSAEEVPASETGSSMMVIVIGAIILLGIIITVGYKLKEK